MTDQKAETELKTLYQITGNAADINTILINRGEFRYLRARVAELEAQLESVGAGGVGPLMPVTMQHQHNPCNINHLQGNTGDLVTSSSSSVPAGWKLVPVEPTREMLVAFLGNNRIRDDLWNEGFRAMLAAAPQPPLAEQPQPVEMLGETCIDGGKCHHKCTELCFRRKCCAPFSDYSGPWNYDQPQPQIDRKDLYQKEKRRAEMWIAKYEKDIGKLQVAVPVAAQPPSVAARTCANCLHNKPPFGNCDGCSQQNDDADDEGNWEPIPEPQGEQGTAAMAKVVGMDEYGPMLLWNRAWTDFPVGTKLYTRPQNLHCKSNQARLAALWGYVKADQQPQGDQEPVAYRHRSFTCGPWEYVSLDDKQRFREGMGQPLYIRPEPQGEQPPAKTFDEVWDAIDWGKWRMAPIRELVREIHSKTSPQPPRQPLTDDQHERLMRGRSTLEYGRSVERAHGIGS